MRDGRDGALRRLLCQAGLLVAVAMAFADSSIVVLALPDLYVDLGTTIVGVSWVVTAFNVATAVACLLLLAVRRQIRGASGLVPGACLFAAASLACGLVDGLGPLVAARAVQGLGAALLLAATLPRLAALRGSSRAAIAAWSGAALAGLALGPATGGILTAALDWRAIFLVQVPVALLAAAAGALRPGPGGVVTPAAAPAASGRALASAALCLLSAALVGALFLAVLLIVTVWDLGPLRGAAVVSALPVGAVVVRLLPVRATQAAAAGPVALAAGLGSLALLPASSVAYVVPALALCGAGIGLASGLVAARAARPTGDLGDEAALSVGVRHAGLVLGLLLVAPLLSRDLARGGETAVLAATRSILEADIGLEAKVPIALDLRRAIDVGAGGRDARSRASRSPTAAPATTAASGRPGTTCARPSGRP